MLKVLRIGLLGSMLLTLLAFGLHPYHVSVTTVHYFKQTQQVNIEIKAFYHDLEPAVNKFTKLDMDIKNHSKTQQRDSAVYAYVNDKFNVYAEKTKLACEPVKIDFKDEYIFIKLLVKNVKPGKISIINGICFETEKTQTNLFHFKWADQKVTKKTVNPQKEVEFTFS